jgi:glutamine synthetase
MALSSVDKENIELLKKNKTKVLRFSWCDCANVIRTKGCYVSEFESTIEDGMAVCTGALTLPVTIDHPVESVGVGPMGEVRLKPDWSSLRFLPYAKGHASVTSDMYSLEGQPSDFCTKHVLRRMIAEAANCGLTIKTGFESEFYLLKKSKDGKGLEPIDSTVYCMSFSMDLNHDVMTDIVDALVEQGLSIECIHPECGPGQQEIVVRYSDPMKAANEMIVVRDTVKIVAHKHGLIGSFLPKIFADQSGNGNHFHFSIHDKDGKNLVPSEANTKELSPLTLNFVAGILDHLPALMAVTVPTTNSFRRILPCAWSGAYLCWGYENRECVVRVPKGPKAPHVSHFEVKTIDICANPYLAIGCIIAAGIDGVKRKLNPPPPLDKDPGIMTEDERKKLNIKLLPQSLDEAIKALRNDAVLMDALQPQMAKVLLGVRDTELEEMKGMTLEQEVDMLLQRY